MSAAVSPKYFINTNPASPHPITAPILFTEYNLLIFHAKVTEFFYKEFKTTGSVPPISVVGMSRYRNEKANLINCSPLPAMPEISIAEVYEMNQSVKVSGKQDGKQSDSEFQGDE